MVEVRRCSRHARACPDKFRKIEDGPKRLFTFLRHHQGLGKGGCGPRQGAPHSRLHVPVFPWRDAPKAGLEERLSVTIGPCFAYPFSVHHHSFETACFPH